MRSHIGYTRRDFRLELVSVAVADFGYQPCCYVLFYRVRRAVEFYRGVGQVLVFGESSRRCPRRHLLLRGLLPVLSAPVLRLAFRRAGYLLDKAARAGQRQLLFHNDHLLLSAVRVLDREHIARFEDILSRHFE